MSSSTPRLGVAFGSSQFEAEATTYLQARLLIYYRAMFWISIGLFVTATIVIAVLPGAWSGGQFSHDRFTHLAAVLIGGFVLTQLRCRRFSPKALLGLDALGFFLGVGTSLVIYEEAYTKGPILMPALIAVFMILRAVIVPSSPRVTISLCLPVLACTFLIQKLHGTIYVGPNERMGPAMVAPAMVWTQVILAAATATAAVASKVNYGLQHTIHKMRQLGQYKLEEKIGEGGMGEVYRATHAMLRRPTAIKLLRPEITGEETIQRFEREVRQTSRLTHPNTVSIYDYGRTPDGVFYYAMEFLVGKDLKSVIEDSGPMPPARVIHVLSQACNALSEAHGEGLVHRDIKAGNLVLCRYGGGQDVVKLVDFGLVRDVSEVDSQLTQVGQICGTPETLAPEVLGGEPATGQSDMYSLAAVGCYLLTGKQIFDAKSPADFIGQHMYNEPIPPSQRLDGVPADLEAILLRGLQKDPEERFADINAMAVALEACENAGQWSQELARAWWDAS